MKLLSLHESGIEDLPDEDGFGNVCRICGQKTSIGWETACSVKHLKQLALSGDPTAAYNYAAGVIQGRWPEGEEIIKQDPEWACWYATYVIKGRWPEGEEIIKQDPKWAYVYAKYVIKGRWPEGEEIIKQDSLWWENYKDSLEIVNMSP